MHDGADYIAGRQLWRQQHRPVHLHGIGVWQMLLTVGLVVSSRRSMEETLHTWENNDADLDAISGSSVEYCGAGCQQGFGVCN
jgi:hypothetical protein